MPIRKKENSRWEKDIWKLVKAVLKECQTHPVDIEGTLSRRFEALRGVINVAVAKNKWTITKSTGETGTFTMRLENNGYEEEEFEEIKKTMNTMRHGLFNRQGARKRALRQELRSDPTARAFFNEMDNGKFQKRRNNRFEDTACETCNKALEDPKYKLGTTHHCKVEARFRCTNRKCRQSWYSRLARYDVENDRVLAQYCKECHMEGVSKDFIVGEETSGPSKKPHLHELCEACFLYGSCQGWFVDLFTTVLAASYYDGYGSPIEYQYDDGKVLYIGRAKVLLYVAVTVDVATKITSEW